MGLFGRRRARHGDHEEGAEPRTIDEIGPDDDAPAADTTAEGGDDGAEPATAPEAAPKRAPGDRAEAGPFDESEADPEAAFVDLGALRVPAREGMELRLDVDDDGRRIVAVTVSLSGSSLQLQAFAEPRSAGVWDEIRGQIVESVGGQHGTATEREGFVGTEVLARLPARGAGGKSTWRTARFVGVDGPRWFLRGVITGGAAKDAAHAGDIEDVFRHVVVVRGSEPVPPRELLTITVPAGMAGDAPETSGDESFDPLARGPEITEVR